MIDEDSIGINSLPNMSANIFKKIVVSLSLLSNEEIINED
jgi:hypothetical protein